MRIPDRDHFRYYDASNATLNEVLQMAPVETQIAVYALFAANFSQNETDRFSGEISFTPEQEFRIGEARQFVERQLGIRVDCPVRLFTALPNGANAHYNLHTDEVLLPCQIPEALRETIWR